MVVRNCLHLLKQLSIIEQLIAQTEKELTLRQKEKNQKKLERLIQRQLKK